MKKDFQSLQTLEMVGIWVIWLPNDADIKVTVGLECSVCGLCLDLQLAGTWIHRWSCDVTQGQSCIEGSLASDTRLDGCSLDPGATAPADRIL